MGIFKSNKINLDDLVMSNGRILVQSKSDTESVYTVIKVAKNVNYIGLNKEIEIGDTLILSEYGYIQHINNKVYQVITPKCICGYFKCGDNE